MKCFKKIFHIFWSREMFYHHILYLRKSQMWNKTIQTTNLEKQTIPVRGPFFPFVRQYCLIALVLQTVHASLITFTHFAGFYIDYVLVMFFFLL